LGAAAVSVAGSFSLFQGLLLWPVGLLLLYQHRRSWRFVIAWLAAAIVTAAVYFHDFNRSASLPPGGESYWLHHPLLTVEFFFTAIGDVVGALIPSGGDPAVLLLGIVVVAIAAWVLVTGVRDRGGGAQNVGLALIVFGLLDAVFLAVGRVSYGTTFAGESWYTLYDLLVPVGCYLALLGRPARERTHRMAKVVWAVLVTVFCLQVGLGIGNGLTGARSWHSKMLETEHVKVNIKHEPDIAVEQIYYVGPPQFVRQMVPIVKRLRLTFFDHA
jgi:hypothetical protein